MTFRNVRQYIRQAEVIIGDKSTSATPSIESDNAKRFAGRIQFNIEKTSESNSNKSVVFLFNLSQESRNFLENRPIVCFVKAGYYGSISTIFFGDVIRTETRRSGPDVITLLECGDAETTLKQAHIEIGLGPNATNQQVVNAAVAKLNVNVGVISGLTTKTYLNGFSYSGTVQKLLDQITKQAGIEWNIQDGELNILPKNSTDGQTAVVVSPTTGLVGFPTKGKENFEFNTLLNPDIRPGRAVQLESKQFQGILGHVPEIASSALIANGAILKVVRADFEGDNQEGPWFTKVQAVLPPGGLAI